MKQTPDATQLPSALEEEWINAEFRAKHEIADIIRRAESFDAAYKTLTFSTCGLCTLEAKGHVKPRSDYR